MKLRTVYAVSLSGEPPVVVTSVDFLESRGGAGRETDREGERQTERERQREKTLTQRRGQPQTRRTLRSGEAQPRGRQEAAGTDGDSSRRTKG